MSSGLSLPQERLLRCLGQYSQSIEKAWDVTREISLPGLSESLGVVRSALNVPLTGLEKQGLIFKRMAHVIGGGSRRRNVYHLTEQGRILFDTLGEDNAKQRKSSSVGLPFGDFPQSGEIHGRSSVIEEAISMYNEQHCIILSGLPGIGKTTVGLAVANEILGTGSNIRWTTANEFSDFETLCQSMAITSPLPSDIGALTQQLAKQHKDETFIFDDVHMISERHMPKFLSICRQMEQLQGPKMIFVGREPLVSFGKVERISIPPLETSEAIKLLGSNQSQEDREHIAERLGGHPLAILLYKEEASLPETNEDIQSYVEEVVLSTLDDSTRSGLDHLVLLPRPIEAKKAHDDEVVGTLDDSAFLRWTSGMEKMELQHLIRNVRRSTMSREEQLQLHKQAVTHWEECAETPDDQIILLFHRICAESDDLDTYCSSAYDTLVSTHSSALSVLFEQAIETSQQPSHLHYLAAKVALDRCEPKHVRRHFDSIEEESHFNEIDMGLAYLEGRIEDADKAIAKGLELGTQQQKNQLALSAASRRLDDRISSTLPKGVVNEIKRYLTKIILPNEPEQRAVTVVALTMVQHALALIEENFTKAETLRATLMSVGGVDGALVMGLKAKSLLIESKSQPHQFSTAVEHTKQAIAMQTSSIHRDSLRLSLVEALLETDEEQAKVEFLQITKPNISPNSVAIHRLHARWWMCKSLLESSMRQIALKEAITQHRAAGCPRAANELEARLHSLL
ncbi:MAG: AAA family ATPase [Euryarchaeota archaeon]|jgi:DNA-binding MarR family transcriptional regulator|nr:AAA family ATPase [Euryarchaeota archaeon]MBT7063678.1 AAA family ATPase [Euryarchaeota archaeon]